MLSENKKSQNIYGTLPTQMRLDTIRRCLLLLRVHKGPFFYFCSEIGRKQGYSHGGSTGMRVIRRWTRLRSCTFPKVDPMEPPKHRHRKVPRGPPSPPVPVLHSPPRKLTAQDQQVVAKLGESKCSIQRDFANIHFAYHKTDEHILLHTCRAYRHVMLSAYHVQAFKVPPCVSNWKNARGYTIPIDKRLAGDVRNPHM
jgi:SNW domain-containing protein 1